MLVPFCVHSVPVSSMFHLLHDFYIFCVLSSFCIKLLCLCGGLSVSHVSMFICCSCQFSCLCLGLYIRLPFCLRVKPMFLFSCSVTSCFCFGTLCTLCSVLLPLSHHLDSVQLCDFPPHMSTTTVTLLCVQRLSLPSQSVSSPSLCTSDVPSDQLR